MCLLAFRRVSVVVETRCCMYEAVPGGAPLLRHRESPVLLTAAIRVRPGRATALGMPRGLGGRPQIVVGPGVFSYAVTVPAGWAVEVVSAGAVVEAAGCVAGAARPVLPESIVREDVGGRGWRWAVVVGAGWVGGWTATIRVRRAEAARVEAAVGTP